MTGFFQGLINKGNTKKAANGVSGTTTTAPSNTTVPADKKPSGMLPSKNPPMQLDPSIIGNNGVANEA